MLIELLAASSVVSGTPDRGGDALADCVLQPTHSTWTPDDVICAFGREYNETLEESGPIEAAAVAKSYLGNERITPDQRAYILEHLAHSQRSVEDHGAAIENYLYAVELIEDSSDRLDSRLITTLDGLGTSLAATNDAEGAARAFERAVHISQVTDGPFNRRQGPVIDRLVAAYVDAGQAERALIAQAHQLETYVRVHGPGDPRTIAAWQRRGELFGALGMHYEAQQLYKHAMREVRGENGYFSPALLPLLDSMAQSYLNHGMNERLSRIGIAKQYLERKVIIVNRNPDIDPLTRAAVYIQMGDFLQKYSGWQFAIQNYRNAWDELGKLPDDETETLRSTYFAQPELLAGDDYLADIPSTDAAEPLSYTQVALIVDVTSLGEPQNIRLDAGPEFPDRLRDRAMYLARKFKFRPRIVDNAAVAATDQQFTLEIPPYSSPVLRRDSQ